jgi:hypothetical protein
MSKFDVVVEGRIKFRYKNIEATRGEDARDKAEATFKEFFGAGNYVIERSYFEAAPEPKVEVKEQAKA